MSLSRRAGITLAAAAMWIAAVVYLVTHPGATGGICLALVTLILLNAMFAWAARS